MGKADRAAAPKRGGWWLDRYQPVISGKAKGQTEGGVVTTGTAAHLETAMVDLIDRANETAIVCSFLLSSEKIGAALERAAGRGVRVYVMTASEQLLDKNDLRLTDFDRRVRTRHLQLLDRLSSVALVRTSPHFHAKAIVVDPLSAPAGMLSTANLVSDAMRKSIDLGIELTAAEAVGVFEILRWGFWNAAKYEGPGQALLSVAEGPEAPAPARGALGRTDLSNTIEEAQLAMLGSATEVLASTFTWDNAHPVSAALRGVARRGGKVELLVRHDVGGEQRDLRDTARLGVVVRGIHRLHAKVLLVPDRGAVVSTSNLSGSSLPSLELGVLLTPDDPRYPVVVRQVRHWYDHANFVLEEVS